MTMPPKAARFRIRTGTVPTQGRPAPKVAASAADDGFGDEPFPTAEQDVLGLAAHAEDEEIAAIRAEALTGRQLRTARRVAMKHGITAASDHDAVRLLRRKGIDPFTPAAALQLIGHDPAGEGDRPRLPQTVPLLARGQAPHHAVLRPFLPGYALPAAPAGHGQVAGIGGTVASFLVRHQARKGLQCVQPG